MTPTVTFTMDGDKMTMLTESTFKNLSCTFKFGEEFEEKTSDGRNVKVNKLLTSRCVCALKI